jgi:hypothetical protein
MLQVFLRKKKHTTTHVLVCQHVELKKKILHVPQSHWQYALIVKK